jgi:soluble P-type ATPase
MLHLMIPGSGEITLTHLVCDLNGTLAIDGQMDQAVRERLRLVTAQLQVHLLTADTYGTLPQLVETLQREGCHIQAHQVTTGDEKTTYVQALGPEQVIALGNGANDVGMFQLVRISIAICGVEGMAKEALKAATLVAPGPEVALDLLLHPRRLIATLRP